MAKITVNGESHSAATGPFSLKVCPELEMAFTTNTLSLVVSTQESGGNCLLGPIRRNS